MQLSVVRNLIDVILIKTLCTSSFFIFICTHSSADIPLSNITSFNSDNCNVMKGARGGVIAKLRSANSAIVDIGCCCHLADLAVKALLKKLPDFSIDNLIMDVTHHFALRYVF